MNIVIYISPRPLLTRILLTRHYIILTNQVFQIGFIWISICIMNKIGMIITTFHRVSKDTAFSSRTINNLTNVQLRLLHIKINL